PSRLADTRCGDNPPGAGSNCSHEPIPANNQTLATMTGGQTMQVNVAGNGGVPSSGAEAAVLQFTVTNTTGNGYLTAWASGASTPNSSNANWVVGQTTANRAIVPIGANGRINVFNFNGNTDVAIDVVGYFSQSSGVPVGGSLFTPVTPSRIYDSRPNSGQTGAGTTLSGNSSLTVQVTGNGGIPGSASNPTLPTAVMANVTEADATQAGFLSVTPSTLTPPASTSDVNFVGGEIRANADLATLSPAGTLSVYNYVGSTDVVLDVFGYFAAAPSGAGTVVNVAPTSGPPGQTVIGNVNSPGSVTSLTVGGCGITSQVLTFNVNTGAFTFNIPATQPPGPCVLTFTSVVNAANVVTQVGFTVTNASPTNAVSFSPPSVTLQANGTSTQVFTITVSAGGTPVGSDGVTLAAVNPASTPGSCGTLNPTSGTTGASGTITTTYTSSTTTGFCTLTATEGGQHAIGGATVVQTIGPPPTTKNVVAVTAVPNAIAANGTSTSTINATVTGPGGVLVGGDQVAFIIVAGTAASCGSVGANPVSTTNGSG
ncbi:MAG: hypothetical protein ACRDYC_00520, partial [Acidimicrobiales bacterium]